MSLSLTRSSPSHSPRGVRLRSLIATPTSSATHTARSSDSVVLLMTTHDLASLGIRAVFTMSARSRLAARGLAGPVPTLALCACLALLPAIAHAQTATPASPAAPSASPSTAAGPTAAAATATTGEALAALLAKPISPSTIAGLVAHAAEPAAQARLDEALTHPTADVRVVAARVAYVTASRDLLQKMRTVLATEPDPTAANELLRAVVSYGGSEELEAGWAAVERLKEYDLPALTESLARHERTELVSHLPRFIANDLVDNALVTRLLDLTAADPAKRREVLTMLGAQEQEVGAVLQDLRTRKETAPPDLLAAWLQSDSARIRTATLWHVLASSSIASATGTPLSEDLRGRADAWRARVQQDDTWESLGVELLARARGRPPQARNWLALPRTEARRDTAGGDAAPALVKLLKGKELGDVSEALSGDRDRLKRQEPPLSMLGLRAERPTRFSARTLPPLAPGLWRALADSHSCPPSPTAVLSATVRYKPDGRPRQIAVAPNVPAGCIALASTLFSLTLFPDDRPTPDALVDTLILPFNEDAVACSDEVVTRVRTPDVRLGKGEGMVAAPKKVHHVNPVYPMASRNAGEQGKVIMEGHISLKGCMREVRLISSSSSRLLDASGILATSAWRFTPAVVNGVEIPVTMFLTVNFTLGRP